MEQRRMEEVKFREAFDTYFDPLCRFLNLYTKDVDVIQDIVQDVFCNLWANRGFLKIEHLKSYLYTATRNKILNHIRDQKLHETILTKYALEEKELYDAYECYDKEQFNKKLNETIEQLPRKCRTVFKLSRFHDMTYKEIAQQEGISEKMVEKHISLALKKIRDSMRRGFISL